VVAYAVDVNSVVVTFVKVNVKVKFTEPNGTVVVVNHVVAVTCITFTAGAFGGTRDTRATTTKAATTTVAVNDRLKTTQTMISA